MPEIPTQLLLPLGAVLAACITGAVSFVSLIVSKEQKTSEFRQTWIDALRADIAEFSSHARRISVERVPIDLRTITGPAIETIAAHNEEALRPDPLLHNRQRLAQTYYSIRLRLNLAEQDHQSLLEHLNSVLKILNSSPSSVRFAEVEAELEKMSGVAQTVLKREWNRVKHGEPAFKLSVGIAKWAVIAFGSLLCASTTYYILKVLYAN